MRDSSINAELKLENINNNKSQYGDLVVALACFTRNISVSVLNMSNLLHSSAEHTAHKGKLWAVFFELTQTRLGTYIEPISSNHDHSKGSITFLGGHIKCNVDTIIALKRRNFHVIMTSVLCQLFHCDNGVHMKFRKHLVFVALWIFQNFEKTYIHFLLLIFLMEYKDPFIIYRLYRKEPGHQQLWNTGLVSSWIQWARFQ